VQQAAAADAGVMCMLQETSVVEAIMRAEEKNRFDALETLRQAAWTAFTGRRSFEWKVCLALWAGIGAYIGTLLSGKVTPQTPHMWGATAAAVVIVLSHAYWIYGLARANELDKEQAFFFRDAMMAELSMEFPKDVIEKIATVKRGWHTCKNWNRYFQITITVLLAAAAALVTWFKPIK
jgi:hypothetical protein